MDTSSPRTDEEEKKESAEGSNEWWPALIHHRSAFSFIFQYGRRRSRIRNDVFSALYSHYLLKLYHPPIIITHCFVLLLVSHQSF